MSGRSSFAAVAMLVLVLAGCSVTSSSPATEPTGAPPSSPTESTESTTTEPTTTTAPATTVVFTTVPSTSSSIVPTTVGTVAPASGTPTISDAAILDIERQLDEIDQLLNDLDAELNSD